MLRNHTARSFRYRERHDDGRRDPNECSGFLRSQRDRIKEFENEVTELRRQAAQSECAESLAGEFLEFSLSLWKKMVGTRRLELLTSTVSRVQLTYLQQLTIVAGDCQAPARTSKAMQSWVEFVGFQLVTQLSKTGSTLVRFAAPRRSTRFKSSPTRRNTI